MRFEERARNAYERGDKIRALVLLIEGVKRNPSHKPGVEFLLALYGDEMTHPGLETDIVRALAPQAAPEVILADIAYRLERRDQDGLLRALTLAAQEKGFTVDVRQAPQWSEPIAEAGPEPEPRSMAALASEVDEVDEVDEAHKGGDSGVLQDDPSDADGSLESEFDDTRDGFQAEEDSVYIARYAVDDDSFAVGRDTSLASGAGPDMTPTVRLSRRRGPILRLRYVLLILVVLAAGSVIGYQVWLEANRAARIARLDAALRSIDPFEEAFLETHFDVKAWPPGEDRQPFDERAFFAQTLIALEAGDGIDVADFEGVTPWGWAGRFHVALMEDDLEAAIVAATRIDLTQPDGLAGSWVKGRLCEARYDWTCADDAYRRLNERFPDFVPAHTARMRMALKRFHRAQWEDAQTKLRKRKSGHAHATLPFPDPFAVLEGTQPPGAFAFEAKADPTTRAFLSVMAGADSLKERRWEAAREHLAASLEADDRLVVAIIIEGILEAAMLRPDDARASFDEAAAHVGLTAELATTLQYWAPMSLSLAGRPDLALRFTAPVEGHGGSGRPAASSRPLEVIDEAWGLRPSSMSIVPSDSESANRALAAHLAALNALGAGLRVDEILRAIAGAMDDADWQVAFEGALAPVSTGSARALQAGVSRARQEQAAHVADLHLAYLEGRYADAIEMGTKLEAAGIHRDFRVVRPLALSYLGAGRGREAVAVIEEARTHVAFEGEWETLRLRVDVRSGQRDDDANRRLDLLGEASPTSITRLVDLATSALWLRRMDRARLHAEKAAEFSPEHPEVNWILGLIERLEGNDSDSRRYFRKAWRGDENEPTRLVEIGYIHLDFGRYAMAQELFYGAVMRDRHNTDALRGMGLSYLGFDRDRGRRDLTRLLSNYGTQPQNAAQRGELYKALGLLHGARSGDDEARPFLEKAQAELGARADVLVEFGHFHHARDEKKAARKAYVAALQKHSTLADAHLGLARVAVELGEERLARDHLERFLALQSVGDEADEARSLLAELRRGENDEAESTP